MSVHGFGVDALVKSEVDVGRPKEDILKGCARIKGVNETILNSIEMTLDYLERMKDHKK